MVCCFSVGLLVKNVLMLVFRYIFSCVSMLVVLKVLGLLFC